MQEMGTTESFSAKEQSQPDKEETGIWGVMRTKAGLGGCALLSTSIYERRKMQEPAVPRGLAGIQEKGLNFSWN